MEFRWPPRPGLAGKEARDLLAPIALDESRLDESCCGTEFLLGLMLLGVNWSISTHNGVSVDELNPGGGGHWYPPTPPRST